MSQETCLIFLNFNFLRGVRKEMIATEAHSYYVSFFCYLFTRSKYRAGSFFALRVNFID